MRLADGHAGLSGLVTCGSVWVCAVCSQKVAARRAVEIGAAVAEAHARGHSVAFVTLTMRHSGKDRLAALWDAVGYAWGQVTGGKVWSAHRAETGCYGFVRAVEVTYGGNGWHVHVHALLFFDRPLTSQTLGGLAHSMFGRWSRAVQRRGFPAPLRVAQDFQLVTSGVEATSLGEYLAKSVDPRGLGAELTQNQSKTARQGHKTVPVWAILDAAIADDLPALRAWLEWERGSKGRRAITWAQGLRELLGIGVEDDDETIAAQEVGSQDDTVVWITPNGWRWCVKHPPLIPEILIRCESLDSAAFSDWLTGAGVEHRRVR